MKIIHTGDWHIGKIVNQVYMTEDQNHILNELVRLIDREKPDVLVIAGDIYDRAVPPVEAVELLDRTLSRIVLDMKTQVILVAGNHDSPDRLGFGSGILEARGLYVEGPLRKDPRKVTLSDAYGPVNFYLVPFAPAVIVRDTLEDREIRDADEAMQAMVARIKAVWNTDERNVIVTHGFVTGGDAPELSESEKPLSYTASVGGADSVDKAVFEGFDYVALGHLHCPQRVGSDRVRYAGSLLKYSFSEVHQKKSVSVVTLGATGELDVRPEALTPLRDMRRIKGRLKDLLLPSAYAGTNQADYLHVTLTDEGGILDPISKLRTVYPNVLALDFESRSKPDGDGKTAAGADCISKSVNELFAEFYGDMTGRSFSSAQAVVLAETAAEAEHMERMS